ncbi:hypothetical protein DP923_02985 [Pontibacter arcticus]|uniref:Uncharacterized protein n=2 Tax=Pontibacter arcticus TaxID=2080288 RepID=A0A364RJU5_9BACT|nr:hypothetical protein DP923_02985 [Pontibacter arcticus]
MPVLLMGFAAHAQNEPLVSFNASQAEIIRIGMLVLGGWAILNIVIGGFKLTKASRSKKFFFQMSLYWNIVNLCIAGASLYTLLSEDVAVRTLAESLQQHEFYKKILYLNIGLDVAYFFLGKYLQQRASLSAKTEQLQGWGSAIVLQGLFLFILDLVLVVLLEGLAPQLFRLVAAS